MKKTVKYILLSFLFLIVIASLFYVFISQQKTKLIEKDDSIIFVSTSTPKESADPTIMTIEEKKALKVNSSTNIQVIRRSATGTPTDYRIIK